MQTERHAPTQGMPPVQCIDIAPVRAQIYSPGGPQFRGSHPASSAAPESPSSRRTQEAISLIEVLGLLAIMAILATVFLPSMIRQLDWMAAQQETRDMKDMADGFERHVLRTRSIPDHLGYATNLAAELGWEASDVTHNKRGRPRLYIIDPLLRVGTNTSQMLPYTQTILGSIEPQSPRILLLSSIGTPLPNTLTNGLAPSTNAFEAIWNAPEGAIPADTTWSGWNGRADDLRIQRLNLEPHFLELILNNDENVLGKFSVDSLSTNTMTTDGFSAFYIKSTALELLSATGNEVQAVEILQRDNSFIFEFGVWRGVLFEGPGLLLPSGSDLAAIAALFLNTGWNTNKFNVDQLQVLNAMDIFMAEYLAWAAAGFPTHPSATKAVDTAQSNLDSDTNRLIGGN